MPLKTQHVSGVSVNSLQLFLVFYKNNDGGKVVKTKQSAAPMCVSQTGDTPNMCPFGFPLNQGPSKNRPTNGLKRLV